MSEYQTIPPRERENDFESRLERAENIVEILQLVDEIMTSDEYINTGSGGEYINLANRKSIQRFGRRAYYEAFDEKYGMARMYMNPPESEE